MARRRRLGARAAVARAAFILGFVGLVAATFANYVLEELGHDEGMYLGASYLAVDRALYSEIGFFQAPNLPLLLSTLYRWGGVSQHLLWGRAITFGHHVVLLVVLAWLAWRYTKSDWVSWLFMLWIGLNGFVFGAAYSIDNTTFASTYLFAGLLACVVARERDWAWSLVASSGLTVGIAAGFKLSYVPFLACFIVALALRAPRRTLGIFVSGATLGLIPMLYMLIDRPEPFWFDNVTWHRDLLKANIASLGARAMATGFASDLWHYVSHPAWLTTLIVSVPLALTLSRLERKPFWRFDRLLLTLVIVAGAATVVALGAVRFWYLQPIAVAGALLIPSVYPELSSTRRIPLGWILVAVASASLWSQASTVARAPRALDPTAWTPARYARLGEAVSSMHDQKLVTAIGNPAIVYGVEAHLRLASSAATGAFVRVSSSLDVRDGRIATLENVSRDADMILATVDYVAPRAGVDPSSWCEQVPNTLIEGWCRAGYELRVVGDGPSRVVVLYREE